MNLDSRARKTELVTELLLLILPTTKYSLLDEPTCVDWLGHTLKISLFDKLGNVPDRLG